MKENSLFIVTGPSGVGKSTLVDRVLKEVNNLKFSVSHTTRPKRKGEMEGKDYYFISRQQFESMIQENRFIEWAEVHGNLYGTSRREMEKKILHHDLILDIDVQGARQVKEKLKRGIFIFIFPPSYEELKKRLQQRGEDEFIIQKRLKKAGKEIRSYFIFDYLLINDDLEKAVVNLKSIILATRCRLEMQTRNILPVLQSFTEY